MNQHVLDFTAARGLAMKLRYTDTRLLVSVIEASNPKGPMVTEFGKELVFHTAMTPGDPQSSERNVLDGFTPIMAQTLLAMHHKDGMTANGDLAELLGDLARIGEPVYDAKEQAELLLMSSLDYVLPRMTGVSHTVREHIEAQWNELSEATQSAVIDKVSTGLASGRTGDEVDRRGWEGLVAKFGQQGAVPSL